MNTNLDTKQFVVQRDKVYFPIAQLVEQATVNRFVLGSSPSRGANYVGKQLTGKGASPLPV